MDRRINKKGGIGGSTDPHHLHILLLTPPSLVLNHWKVIILSLTLPDLRSIYDHCSVVFFLLFFLLLFFVYFLILLPLFCYFLFLLFPSLPSIPCPVSVPLFLVLIFSSSCSLPCSHVLSITISLPPPPPCSSYFSLVFLLILVLFFFLFLDVFLSSPRNLS